MVMKPEPLFAAIEEVRGPKSKTIYLAPDGERLTPGLAQELNREEHLVLLSGHYEGIDQRVRDALVDREVSIGDYVLSGGEPAAIVFLDAVVRLLPGVMGSDQSGLEESFENGLLEHPHYTRPRDFEGQSIPDVLLSGDHAAIARWRRQRAEQLTAERRPDLMAAQDKEKTTAN